MIFNICTAAAVVRVLEIYLVLSMKLFEKTKRIESEQPISVCNIYFI